MKVAAKINICVSGMKGGDISGEGES